MQLLSVFCPKPVLLFSDSSEPAAAGELTALPMRAVFIHAAAAQGRVTVTQGRAGGGMHLGASGGGLPSGLCSALLLG